MVQLTLDEYKKTILDVLTKVAPRRHGDSGGYFKSRILSFLSYHRTQMKRRTFRSERCQWQIQL